MTHIEDLVLQDICFLVDNLARDGGLMGPSVYDSAQVLRFAPPARVGPALHWLCEQQQADGGWGAPDLPLTRDMPTLAAVLALHQHSQRVSDQQALQAGLAFLRRNAVHWCGPLGDDIPGGVELLLPRLLDDAAHAGLAVDRSAYTRILALGRRRREYLARLAADQLAGTTATHSWEGWGSTPDPAFLDGAPSIGHSPAATAAWLAADRQQDQSDRAAIHDYLIRAATATGVGIAGVVPTSWPIPDFERAFALYALLLADLLDQPLLQASIQPQIDALARALRPAGLGMSPWFRPDGDDTAAAVAVLRAAGRPVEPRLVHWFGHDDHFCAWTGELQPSLSVTAHAVHALALCAAPAPAAVAYLQERQQGDGRWIGDKWHGSWIYTTLQVAAAIVDDAPEQVLRAAQALFAYQYSDGGWGMHESTSEETAYAVLFLRLLSKRGLLSEPQQARLVCAERWLLDAYRPFATRPLACWLGKQPYRPERVSRMFELVALVPRKGTS